MNTTYKDSASFVGTEKEGREGWLSKAQKAAASTSSGQGPRGKRSWHWDLGPRGNRNPLQVPWSEAEVTGQADAGKGGYICHLWGCSLLPTPAQL